MPAPPLDASARIVAQRYRLGRKLGEGAVATVYEAEDVVARRRVAVKLLKDIHDEDDTARLWVELRSLERVTHPGVLRPLDWGQSGQGLGYIVTELLRGRTLRERMVAQGRIPPAEAAPFLVQMFEILAACHAAGVIHRDIKPENVFLLAPGEARIKIIDFGMAKLTEDSGTPQLTRPHSVFGTPEYMAPERVVGAPPTPASDVYAAAVVGYEMLAGQRPFGGNDPEGVMRRQLRGAPPRFSELSPPASVPRPLRSVIRRCLRKAPEQRPTAAAAAEILRKHWSPPD